jgi:hypothetical protein
MSRMAWLRARDKPGLVRLAWSRAMRTVTVTVLYS